MNREDVIHIPNGAYSLSNVETAGSKFKFWLYEHVPDHDIPWLYKEGQRQDSGEDWAEVVVSLICNQLQLPHAIYVLATWENPKGVKRRGVVTKRFFSRTDNELILGSNTFPSLRKHELLAVLEFIKSSDLDAPICPYQPHPRYEALMVFIGYIMLDALIGHTDRHPQNWGYIRRNGHQNDVLSPTFDHASSLGIRLNQTEKNQRLNTKDKRYSVDYYSYRCRSCFFYKGKQLRTIEAFCLAALSHPYYAKPWLERLKYITPILLRTAIFSSIPQDRITKTDVDFAIEMIDKNKSRLLRIHEALKCSHYFYS